MSRDHWTLIAEVSVHPTDLPEQEPSREKATDWRKLSIPIHHIESLSGATDVAQKVSGRDRYVQTESGRRIITALLAAR